MGASGKRREAPRGGQQGNNREFSRNRLFSAKIRLENVCEFSSLRDEAPEIPCATEQGNNSTTTENQFATNRELIRHIRESGIYSARGAKVRALL
jgi:hypothetical protein